MAKKESLESFVKNLGRFAQVTQQEALSTWNQATLEVLVLSKKKAPQSNLQRLSRSLENVKARITKSGVVSKIESELPYSSKLHNDLSLNLKNKGEVSYYKNGQKILKLKKGEHGYVAKAAKSKGNLFVEGMKKVISKAWNRI